MRLACFCTVCRMCCCLGPGKRDALARVLLGAVLSRAFATGSVLQEHLLLWLCTKGRKFAIAVLRMRCGLCVC
jgi:hypothetical protein